MFHATGATLYRCLEAVLGRALLWRIGRWLYQSARRQSGDDPDANGEYVLQERIVALRQGSAGRSVFVDIGAYRGAWTKNLLDIAARQKLSDIKIIAFEPSPEIAALLRTRFKDNIVKGEVTVDARAVGASETMRSFELAGMGGTSRLTPEAAVSPASDTIAVSVTTIDAVVRELKLEQIALLKVDAEGNDLNVIRGAEKSLAAGLIGVVQFEYNWVWLDFGSSLHDLFHILKRLDYEFGLLAGSEIEIYRKWHPELDRFMLCNAVLVRRDLLPVLPHRVMTFNISNVPVAAV